MKHYGDITKINGAEVEPVNVICGGSPCQDLSVAGKRAGLAGERSGLFMDQIRVIKEMRANERKLHSEWADELIRPRYMVWENVPGAFSSNNGEDFRAVLEETIRVIDKDAHVPMPENGRWSYAGVIMGTVDGREYSVAWRTHDAQYWGVAQRRRRISLVADFGGTTAAEILFECEGMSGNPEPCGTEGQGAAEDFEGRTDSAISFQERAGKPGGGKGILIQNEHTGALNQQCGQSVCYNSWDVQSKHIQPQDGGSPACNQGGMAVVQGADVYNGQLTGDVAATLNAASGTSGTHSGPSVVETFRKTAHPMNAEQGQGWEETDVNDTLNCHDNGESRTPTLVLENHPADSRVKICEDNVFQTLPSRMGTGGGNVPMVMEQMALAEVATTRSAVNGEKGVHSQMLKNPEENFVVACIGNGQVNDAVAMETEKSKTLSCMDDPMKIVQAERSVQRTGSVVRRLTPKECERLQGFPDDWTNIGEWTDSRGKTHKDADSPRYKALGNSIALPFWRWMAKRMARFLPDGSTMASLFDGIGGFPISFILAGVKPIWASEIEEFPIAVTKRHFGDDGDYARFLQRFVQQQGGCGNPGVYGLDRASFNQGQNAKYSFSVDQELAQTVVARGPGGVLTEQ